MLKKFNPKSSLPSFHFLDLHPPLASLEEEVLAGLSQVQKNLSPKWFYDERGSDLFNHITRCEEYYLTRAEISILENNLEEILAMIGENATLIEYGCGDSRKVEILLDHLPLAEGYIPLDISKTHLLELARRISKKYPQLGTTAVCCDFTQPLQLPFLNSYYSKKIAFFPGSSIGNFEPSEAKKLLSQIRQLVGQKGKLLIGFDVIKDPAILNAAYNDQHGWTAQFNLNLLHRINRECQGDFNIQQFKHQAFYHSLLHRIEMHLVSKQDQIAFIGENLINFKNGETIHTENSYKYDLSSFQNLMQSAGWRSLKIWTDPQNLFAIHFLEAA